MRRKNIKGADTHAAFNAVYKDYGQRIYNIALYTVGEAAGAQEVTQLAFIRIWKGLGKFRGDAQLSTWIYRIVKNVAFSWLKTQGRRQKTFGGEMDVEPAARDGNEPVPNFEKDERKAGLHRALSRLAPAQRLALSLYYFEELPYEHIAEVTEQALGTVKSHIFRGKAALAHLLEDKI